MQRNIDPAFLNRATTTLIERLVAPTTQTGEPKDSYKITRNPRYVTITSRQTIDVSVETASPVNKRMFLPTDEPLNVLSPFEVLTSEPTLIYGQATPSTQALGIVGSTWSVGTQQIFGVAPEMVNSVIGVMGRAVATFSQGGAVVSGPRMLREALSGDLGVRVSEGTTAGELIGGVEGGCGPAFEPQILVIEPQSTVAPVISFDGSLFATSLPIIDTDFFVEWTLHAIMVNVVKRAN